MKRVLLQTAEDVARWLRAQGVHALRDDSRQVQAGDAFFAWPGSAVDGRDYLPLALERGASACVVEAGSAAVATAPVAEYADLKAGAGPIAAAWYGAPSRQMTLVAVTGTNGKTSTAWWLAAALSRLRGTFAPCAFMGTLGCGVPPEIGAPGLTTPGALDVQRLLHDFVQDGVRAVALEASSIGLAEHRLDGTAIAVAIFTNFTQDHLDYHGTMEAYWQAKALLFDWPGLRAAVVNVDDPRGPGLARHVQECGLDVWTVSLDGEARLMTADWRHDAAGWHFAVREGAEDVAFPGAFLARYNVANVLEVIAAQRALGVPLTDAVRACADLPAVPGRMERIAVPGAPLAVVDFAHTPDALTHCLQALQPLARQRGGRLWCVFGCGGDRDHGKRPLMAAAVLAAADHAVLTSDNPRSEEPQAIVDDMLAGVPADAAVRVELDRARAIALALNAAAPEDVVLIAGKGHERTQEAHGVRHPFVDQDVARAALRERVQWQEAGDER